jgi:hypothetical protein
VLSLQTAIIFADILAALGKPRHWIMPQRFFAAAQLRPLRRVCGPTRFTSQASGPGVPLVTPWF